MSLPKIRGWILLPAALAAAACADSPLAPDDAGAASRTRPSFIVSGTTFDDGLDPFSTARWSPQEHTLGRGPLLAANVQPYPGGVHLATSSAGFQGAEIASREWYGWGVYTARMSCGVPAGALCAFFLYQGGARKADEIDIEIEGGTGRIYYTTWVQGRRTNSTSAVLADPAAFHDLEIEYRGDRVVFRVDGVEQVRFTRKLPTRAMLVMSNAWWPTWLAPAGGSAAGYLDLDRIVAGS